MESATRLIVPTIDVEKLLKVSAELCNGFALPLFDLVSVGKLHQKH